MYVCREKNMVHICGLVLSWFQVSTGEGGLSTGKGGYSTFAASDPSLSLFKIDVWLQ